MRTRLSAVLSVIALASLTSIAGAQAKQAATVTCNDGTTSTATGKGACSSHGGVKKPDTKSDTKASTTKSDAKTPAKPAPATKPAGEPKAAGKTATKPASKTAMVKCTDGTMSKGGQGACSSHGGIAKPK